MADRPAGTEKPDRDRRFRWIAWAVFLVMWGGTLLVERAVAMDLRNLQYILAGLILLGLNAARFSTGISMSRLTLIVGFLALFGGLVRQFTGDLSIIPIVLITAGALLLAQGIMAFGARS